jgi:hypothetical protein
MDGIMGNVKADYDRGKVENIRFKKPLNFNGNSITEAIIEIDHINHGLNKTTRNLNVKKRSNFTVSDVEKFLMLLDGEYLVARNHKGRVSQFEVRIDCPIRGKFYGKEFIMIFDTNYDSPKQIHTITLYPGW